MAKEAKSAVPATPARSSGTRTEGSGRSGPSLATPSTLASINERSDSFHEPMDYSDAKEDDEEDDLEEKAAMPELSEAAAVSAGRSGGVRSLARNLTEEFVTGRWRQRPSGKMDGTATARRWLARRCGAAEQTQLTEMSAALKPAKAQSANRSRSKGLSLELAAWSASGDKQKTADFLPTTVKWKQRTADFLPTTVKWEQRTADFSPATNGASKGCEVPRVGRRLHVGQAPLGPGVQGYGKTRYKLNEVAGPEPAHSYGEDESHDHRSSAMAEDANSRPNGGRPPLNGDTPAANRVLGRYLEPMKVKSNWMRSFAPEVVRQAIWLELGGELTVPVESWSTRQVAEDTVKLLRAMGCEPQVFPSEADLRAWAPEDAATALRKWKQKLRSAFGVAEAGVSRPPNVRHASDPVDPSMIPLSLTPGRRLRESTEAGIFSAQGATSTYFQDSHMVTPRSVSRTERLAREAEGYRTAPTAGRSASRTPSRRYDLRDDSSDEDSFDVGDTGGDLTGEWARQIPLNVGRSADARGGYPEAYNDGYDDTEEYGPESHSGDDDRYSEGYSDDGYASTEDRGHLAAANDNERRNAAEGTFARADNRRLRASSGQRPYDRDDQRRNSTGRDGRRQYGPCAACGGLTHSAHYCFKRCKMCKQVHDAGRCEAFQELTNLLRAKVEKKDLSPELQEFVYGSHLN
uniref:Eukaryotic/viral aspartic protease n=2 Tax=Phytophthora ramorum TaxID=164328 RepID=H3H6M2_PHYRM